MFGIGGGGGFDVTSLFGGGGGAGAGGFDFMSLLGGGGGQGSADFSNILNFASGNTGAIPGFGFGDVLTIGKGFSQFGGDVDGIVPYEVAYGQGAGAGQGILGLFGNSPLASLPSPANMDPSANLLGLFGVDRGILSFLGEGIEGSTGWLDEIGFVGGIAASFAFTGGAGAGTFAKVGANGGAFTAGFIDETSDAGVGLFDLDGKETRNNNGPLNLNFFSA